MPGATSRDAAVVSPGPATTGDDGPGADAASPGASGHFGAEAEATTGAVSDGPGRGGATGLIVFGGGAGRDGAVLLGLLIVVGGGGGRFTPSAVGAAGNAENALPQFG